MTPDTAYSWYAEVTNDQGGLTRTAVQTFTTETASTGAGSAGGNAGSTGGSNGATGDSGNGTTAGGGTVGGTAGAEGSGSAGNAGQIVEPDNSQGSDTCAQTSAGGALSQTGDVVASLAVGASVIVVCAAALAAIAQKLHRRASGR
ncbi:hypothetical protein [uncultured Senegalimassilia sp.]|uniref:hypothetical protein n=1 Tax=uncultured Senegalimassilia sp. TaxID=1714350 RepID=UPI002622F950|nr:hypothetical protein [uncultured Senegalimassilia sp.]